MLHEEITDRILACAVTVHKALGPGLAEASYQAAMALELTATSILFQREPSLSVLYRGVIVGQHRPDFIIESVVVLELKSVARFDPVFTAQLLTYLRVTGLKVGLLINFNVPSLNHGIKRLVL
jgi:GxxExxY protein